MTVYELIQYLSEFDPHSEVKLAEQPRWPFVYNIKDVIEVDDTVYIVEGEQIDYLDEKVSKKIGWEDF